MKISGGINFSISSEPCTVEQRLVGSESGPTAKSDKGQEWQYWVPHVRRATVSWAGASGRRGSRSQSHTRDTSSAGWAHHCTGVEGSRGRGVAGSQGLGRVGARSSERGTVGTAARRSARARSWAQPSRIALTPGSDAPRDLTTRYATVYGTAAAAIVHLL